MAARLLVSRIDADRERGSPVAYAN